jgi:quercetin dioxygenase-like cupin family protein
MHLRPRLLFVLVFALAVTTARAQSLPQCAPLASAVFPADSGRVRVGAGARYRSLVDTATANLTRLEIHVTTLAPGASPHPPHRHAHEELMIVQSGRLDALQGGVVRRAGPGAVIFEASNELHGLHNPGPDSATYVVIRIDPPGLASPDRARCRAATGSAR